MSEQSIGLARITVLSIEPIESARVFALASVEIDIDGVVLVVHGIQATRCDPVGTKITLPKFRDHKGVWRPAVSLPDEVKEPIADAVLDAMIERGVAKRRFEPSAVS
jgi:hypothetical protein